MASLGVLSVHLDGEPCRVGCEYCYLGAREAAPSAATKRRLPVLDSAANATARPSHTALIEMVNKLDYDELAIALSEPVEPVAPMLKALFGAARARQKLTTVTTTLQVAGTHRALLAEAGIGRINLSVDPRKGRVLPGRIAQLARLLKQDTPGLDVVLVATLITPAFASWLLENGGLRTLLELDPSAIDKVALSALKPPPPWCDRAFWMRTLAELDRAGLLREHLDRRLFLDCYVAARWLGLGGCPARPDLSPSGAGDGAWAFRGCVYQPRAESTTADAELVHALATFEPPAQCPFPT